MKKLRKLAKNELFGIITGSALFIPALVLERLEFNTGALVLYVLALLFAGFGVFHDALRGIMRRDLLDEKFLMTVASIGAMIIGERSEGVAVMLFFLASTLSTAPSPNRVALSGRSWRSSPMRQPFSDTAPRSE